eukprot:498208-Prymnesium_polylepis.1
MPSAAVLARPHEWWVYAIRCVRFDLDRTRAKTAITWSSFSAQLKAWTRYMALYIRRAPLGAPWLEPLDQDQEKELRTLEDAFAVDELVVCRQRADYKLALQKTRVLERLNVRSQAFAPAVVSPLKSPSRGGADGKGSADAKVSAADRSVAELCGI